MAQPIRKVSEENRTEYLQKQLSMVATRMIAKRRPERAFEDPPSALELNVCADRYF